MLRPYYMNYLKNMHMKRIIALSFVFIVFLLTSCKTAAHVCDAYTMKLKKEKIEQLKNTASLSIEIVHN